MDQIIESQLNGRNPNKVKKLVIEKFTCMLIVGLTEDFTSLVKLSMRDIGLEELDNLPALPSLKHLDISENLIMGSLENLLKCPNLIGIDISRNMIYQFESLQPLSELENLKALNIFENNFNKESDYFVETFELNPSLVFVDRFDRNSCEADPGEYAAYMEGDDDYETNEDDGGNDDQLEDENEY